MAYQIFISYRRNGSEFLGKILYDRLTASGYSVFFDVETLRSGAFNKQLFEHIDNCTDFILLLPKNALDRCIEDPNDWVLLEIERAIQKNKKIIPIMMRGFDDYPKNLPASIASLRYCQALNAREQEYFDAAYDKLITDFLDSKPSVFASSSNPFPVTVSERLTETVLTVMSYLKKAGLDINDFISLYSFKINNHDIMIYFKSLEEMGIELNDSLKRILATMEEEEAKKKALLLPLATWIAQLPNNQLRELDDFYNEIKSLRFMFKSDGSPYRASTSIHFADNSVTWDVMDIFKTETVKWIIATKPTDSLLPEIGIFQVVGNNAVKISTKSPDYVAALFNYVCLIRLMDLFPSNAKRRIGSDGILEYKMYINQLFGVDIGFLLDNNDFLGRFLITGNYTKKGLLFSKTSRVTIGTDYCETVDIKTNKDNDSTPFGKEQLLDIVKVSENISDDTYVVLTSTPTKSGTKFFSNDPHVYEVYKDSGNDLIDYTERKLNGTSGGLATTVLERFALRLHFYRIMGIVE